MSVIALQKRLNAFFKTYKIPYSLVVDGNFGPATRAAIVIAKQCLGYTLRYATGTRTPVFYAQLLRPLNRNLTTAKQRARGTSFRARIRTGDSTAALASRILHHPNINSRSYSSPSGGYAQAGLIALSLGKQAPVSASNRPHNFTDVNKDLLKFLLDLGDYGYYGLNCLTNGHHRDQSGHYYGRCGDINKSDQSRGVRNNIDSVGAKHRIGVLREDSAHDHVYAGGTP
jgi:hypothetical protein